MRSAPDPEILDHTIGVGGAARDEMLVARAIQPCFVFVFVLCLGSSNIILSQTSSKLLLVPKLLDLEIAQCDESATVGLHISFI